MPIKRIFTGIFTLLWIGFSLTGCMRDVLEVTVAVENASDFELKWVVFDLPQSSGTYSPMHHIITAEDEALKPGEERKITISLVKNDLGNSGGALIGLIEDGNSDSMLVAKGEVILERGTNRFMITHDGKTFVIMADDN